MVLLILLLLFGTVKVIYYYAGYSADILGIVDRASKEVAIEELLKNLEEVWLSMQFQLKPFYRLHGHEQVKHNVQMYIYVFLKFLFFSPFRLFLILALKLVVFLHSPMLLLSFERGAYLVGVSPSLVPHPLLPLKD